MFVQGASEEAGWSKPFPAQLFCERSSAPCERIPVVYKRLVAPNSVHRTPAASIGTRFLPSCLQDRSPFGSKVGINPSTCSERALPTLQTLCPPFSRKGISTVSPLKYASRESWTVSFRSVLHHCRYNPGLQQFPLLTSLLAVIERFHEGLVMILLRC